MKKRISCIIALLVIMTASGCGTKGNDQKVDNPSNVQNPQETKKPANDEVKQEQEEQAKPPITSTKPAVPVTTTKIPTTTTKPETSTTTPKPMPKPTPTKPTVTPTVEDGKVAVSGIMKKITEEVELYSMMDVKKEEMKDFYYINPDDVEEYVIKIPMMNVKATEIAIIKVKDGKDVESVKVGINKRLKDLERTWEQYLPDQYEMVKNNILKSNGQYIILIIHEDSKKIEGIFDSFFKK